jgi:hypothetical protein
MFTRPFPSALASTCSSFLVSLCVLVVLLSAPADAQSKKKRQAAPAEPKTLLEAEVALAQEKGVYLILRPAAKELTVRSRGLALEKVALEKVAFMRYHSTLGERGHTQAKLPLALVVAESVEGDHRKVIAPVELKPYPEEGEEEEATPIQVTSGPSDVMPAPPTTYTIALDGGWKLLVTQNPPEQTWRGRLLYTLKDGWYRLRGRPTEQADLLVFGAKPEDAQRIYHLFQAGVRILLDPS